MINVGQKKEEVAECVIIILVIDWKLMRLRRSMIIHGALEDEVYKHKYVYNKMNNF